MDIQRLSMIFSGNSKLKGFAKILTIITVATLAILFLGAVTGAAPSNVPKGNPGNDPGSCYGCLLGAQEMGPGHKNFEAKKAQCCQGQCKNMNADLIFSSSLTEAQKEDLLNLWTSMCLPPTTTTTSTTTTTTTTTTSTSTTTTIAAVCGNGIVEGGEQCDGGACCTGTCQLISGGTVCRTAAGVCDIAETCTGISATCPSDIYVPAGTVCRVSSGTCDLAESCTGSSVDCPADSFVSVGTPCDDGLFCTVSDTCNGAWNCISGAIRSCNDNNTCTNDACNEFSDSCLNTPVADGTPTASTCGVGACQSSGVCINGTDTCTPGFPGIEACDNLDNDCDGTVDEGLGTTTCGVGECQRTVNNCVNGVPQACTPGTPSAEICNGLDDDCDGIVDGISQSCYTGPAGTAGVGECKAGTKTCTTGVWGACTGEVTPTAETCDGLDNDCDGSIDEGVCPTTTTTSTTTTTTTTTTSTTTTTLPVCGNGILESGEQCDGGVCCTGTCQFASAGTVCRFPADQCDATEFCTGSSADCPANSYVPDGWACNDGNACTQNDACSSGVCTSGNPVSCDDGNACTIDSCDPDTGCVHTPITGCQ